jgi:hypothetical protein
MVAPLGWLGLSLHDATADANKIVLRVRVIEALADGY